MNTVRNFREVSMLLDLTFLVLVFFKSRTVLKNLEHLSSGFILSSNISSSRLSTVLKIQEASSFSFKYCPENSRSMFSFYSRRFLNHPVLEFFSSKYCPESSKSFPLDLTFLVQDFFLAKYCPENSRRAPLLDLYFQVMLGF